MTRTVLVTGAAGFVGSHLLARLSSDGGVRTIGFDRCTPVSGAWHTVRIGDVTSRDEVVQLVRESRPDEVYHLAGVAQGCAAELETVNVLGTRNLLEAVAAHSPGAALIAVGSAAEYGRTAAQRSPLTEEDPCAPADGYGRTKHAATLATIAAAAQGLRANVVRPFNLVGAGVPDSLVVGAIVARMRVLAAAGGGELPMGNVDALRDFVDVGDAVAGMVALARSGYCGRVFNLCSGRARSIRKVISQVACLAGVEVQVVPDPGLIRSGEVAVSVGSCAAASAAFGFRPATPLSDSLRAAWRGLDRREVS